MIQNKFHTKKVSKQIILQRNWFKNKFYKKLIQSRFYKKKNNSKQTLQKNWFKTYFQKARTDSKEILQIKFLLQTFWKKKIVRNFCEDTNFFQYISRNYSDKGL